MGILGLSANPLVCVIGRFSDQATCSLWLKIAVQSDEMSHAENGYPANSASLILQGMLAMIKNKLRRSVKESQRQ